ncbi:hypothetical protein SKAU_G00132390 [Synaphobranchus kaupii]|uniref:Transmembrane protein 265 n=1 Tax=Synaphobranchus kaupii TaxID=118154 RepID=A0A9Q1FQU5_SYNKA|nr:hypothetical protein SKAU_G00132390 [Synaphobranchus kaupii]
MENKSEEITNIGLGAAILDQGMANIPKSATGENITMETGPDLENISRMHNDITSHVRDYRWLAIGSIICGISCIGICALINSVKVRERRESDPEKAQVYSDDARKLSFIAIAVWIGLIILIPVMMAIISYLLTLKD